MYGCFDNTFEESIDEFVIEIIFTSYFSSFVKIGNYFFAKKFAEVNLWRLAKAIEEGKLDAGKPIDAAALRAAGLIRRDRDGVKLLGEGEITVKVEITAYAATAKAKAASAPAPAPAAAARAP